MRLGLTLLLAVRLFAAGPLRFEITLDPSLTQQPVSGRLLVFLSNDQTKKDHLGGGFVPGETWVAAEEITAWRPGETKTFDPDHLAYPKPFSQAPKGKLQFMALLDLDHSYARGGQGPGDLFSDVLQAEVDPTATDAVKLTIKKVTPERPPLKDTDAIKLVEFESELLSKFWGRPITMRAGVVLPPSYATADKKYATVYRIHGFGGDHSGAWRSGPNLVKEMKEGKRAEMVHVFLDGSFPTGHHVFADSVNNGPWGRALVEEFIPFLEEHFRLIDEPRARFLTGHSSGGWSSLWVQVSHPDFFNGTWSTAPDPVDLRSFTGVNATPGSKQNAYIGRDGRPLNLVRNKGKEIASFEQFVKQEEVLGPVGGQIASFEWVWSPKGPDGRPLQLFNRATGEQNPAVQDAWQAYDIRLILMKNWDSLGPALQGKLHIVCGTEDTFHLEEGVTFLCDYLKSKGREDACELVPGRDHGDLYRPYKSYPDGLDLRIAKEMQAALEAATRR
jgi:hypothetical protein